MSIACHSPSQFQFYRWRRCRCCFSMSFGTLRTWWCTGWAVLWAPFHEPAFPAPFCLWLWFLPKHFVSLCNYTMQLVWMHISAIESSRGTYFSKTSRSMVASILILANLASFNWDSNLICSFNFSNCFSRSSYCSARNLNLFKYNTNNIYIRRSILSSQPSLTSSSFPNWPL